jgi:hypothetical protein
MPIYEAILIRLADDLEVQVGEPSKKLRKPQTFQDQGVKR